MVGLRGVGKTVLLDRMRDDAEAAGVRTLRIEAPEHRPGRGDRGVPYCLREWGTRFDRLTQAEKRYLRAMAEVGSGPHRSGDVADELGRKVTALGPTRSNLISKGMIWSPYHGDTAFTVPLLDDFTRRILPGEEWRAAGNTVPRAPEELPMTVQEVSEILRRHQAELQARGVESLSVFGSTARGEGAPGSDVDLLARFTATPTLFDLGGLQVLLEEVLGRRVDLLTVEMLRPEIRDRVLSEAVRAA